MEVRSLQSSIALTSYQQNSGQSISKTLAASGSKPVLLSASLQTTNPSSISSVNPASSLASTQAVIGVDKVSQTNATRAVSENQGVTAITGGVAQSEADEAASSTEVQYNEEELAQIRELAERDREVRSHEAAHAAAGGAHAGAPSYSYTRGPDGKLYATEGAVSVDTSAVPDDPEATIAKAETIIRAALAPANPSPQDLKVAAEAQALLVNAQAELGSQRAQRSSLSAYAEALVAEEKAQDEASDEDKKPLFSPQPLDKDKLSANADSITARLERSREQQQEFATQLQELNRKVGKVLEQLINTGATAGVESQGTFINTRA